MHTLSMPEPTLEAPLLARESPASSDVVKAFGSRVFSIARHITQNDADAEAVLVETFLKICSDSNRCQQSEHLWLRLVTIAVNQALSILRRRGGGPRLSQAEDPVVQELSVWGDDYQQRHSKEETTHILENGLRSLDPMARTVFVLRDIEQVSVEQIAEIVNRSVAAIEICLLRARLHLREVLARQMRR